MRKVFFSFHYETDNWRVNQIKNMDIVEGQKICNSNDWEKVKLDGDEAIKNWIDNNMRGCSCLVVLIGSETASRKWIKYEIKKAWNDGKGVLGIYIHNLKDQNGRTSRQGRNPFDNFSLNKNNRKLSEIVPVFNPNMFDPYNDIKVNLNKYIDYAINIRNKIWKN